MRELMKKEVVFFRSSLGTYAFKNNIGINIEEAIEKKSGGCVIASIPVKC